MGKLKLIKKSEDKLSKILLTKSCRKILWENVYGEKCRQNGLESEQKQLLAFGLRLQ